MIFLICALLFIVFLFVVQFEKYLLHPSVIISGMFLLSCITVAIRYKVWGDIDFATGLIVLSSVLIFVIGAYMGEKTIFSFSKYSIRNLNNIYSTENRIEKKKTIFVIVFMIVITVLDFLTVVSFSSNGLTGLLNIVTSARRNSYITGKTVSYSLLLQQGLYISKCIAYIYTYNIAIVVYKQKEKIFLMDLLPIFIYLIQALLSTGRTEFLYFFYAVLVINYCVMKNEDKWVKKGERNYIKYIIIVIIIFVAIFSVIANARNNGSEDLVSIFLKYIGSSISALSCYVKENSIGVTSKYWGQYTQYLYYKILNALHISYRNSISVMPEIYIGVNNEMTNIYSSIGRYLRDFSLIGVLLIFMFLGFFYSKLFNRLKKEYSGIRILLYAFLSYPIIEIAIEERFFSSLLTARTICIILYTIILYKLLIKNNDIHARS